jgi:protein involved in polysaccharide export with SLBB domain
MLFRRVAILGASLVCFATAPAFSQAAPGTSAASAVIEGYQLGAGDKVRIITFGEPSLTGEFQVSDSGSISMPLIGEIKAMGATTTDLQQRIVGALKEGYIKNPSVSVEVLNFRPFYILGEVTKPGEYPYTTGGTVLNAVATASGFTYRANTHRVMIKHFGEAEEKLYELNASTLIRPGDTIRIVERHF